MNTSFAISKIINDHCQNMQYLLLSIFVVQEQLIHLPRSAAYMRQGIATALFQIMACRPFSAKLSLYYYKAYTYPLFKQL